MRRRLFALVLFGIVAIVLLVFGLPNDAITSANCDRVQPGMSETQVERILGSRGTRINLPDEAHFIAFCDVNLLSSASQGDVVKVWLGPGAEIYVLFDSTGRVVAARYWRIDWDGDVFRMLRRAVGP